jgi:uncharacterized protein YfcZ (UPF0381/DUF406 family)
MPDQPTTCECGHNHDQHHRVIISIFPCDHCTCGDFSEIISDSDTTVDFDTIFNSKENQ